MNLRLKVAATLGDATENTKFDQRWLKTVILFFELT